MKLTVAIFSPGTCVLGDLNSGHSGPVVVDLLGEVDHRGHRNSARGEDEEKDEPSAARKGSVRVDFYNRRFNLHI